MKHVAIHYPFRLQYIKYDHFTENVPFIKGVGSPESNSELGGGRDWERAMTNQNSREGVVLQQYADL